jgi:hypothetical protein
MTEFKITPEDVGRVAVDGEGSEWRIVCIDERVPAYPVVARGIEGGRLPHVFSKGGVPNLNSFRDFDFYNLTHWKPRTLVARKRWWNVYRHGGYYRGYPHGTHEEAAAKSGAYTDSTLIARIYAEHWHGCEEGRFDTPESIEGEES